MSYIQIEIGGKLRGLKFNKMAQIELQRRLGTTNAMGNVYILVYAGLTACSFAKDEPVDYTFEDVCDWCDVLSDDDVLKISDAFQATEFYKKTATFLADQEELKKKEATPEITPLSSPLLTT